jgi:hypothetical protein
MKAAFTLGACAALALLPLQASACGDYDETMASAPSASRLGAAPAPQASKVPLAKADTAVQKVKEAKARNGNAAQERKVVASVAR